jgi:hypothetical protein
MALQRPRTCADGLTAQCWCSAPRPLQGAARDAVDQGLPKGATLPHPTGTSTSAIVALTLYTLVNITASCSHWSGLGVLVCHLAASIQWSLVVSLGAGAECRNGSPRCALSSTLRGETAAGPPAATLLPPAPAVLQQMAAAPPAAGTAAAVAPVPPAAGGAGPASRDPRAARLPRPPRPRPSRRQPAQRAAAAAAPAAAAAASQVATTESGWSGRRCRCQPAGPPPAGAARPPRASAPSARPASPAAMTGWGRASGEHPWQTPAARRAPTAASRALRRTGRLPRRCSPARARRVPQSKGRLPTAHPAQPSAAGVMP